MTREEPAKATVANSGASASWWIPGGMLLLAAGAIVAWWIWPPSQELRELEQASAGASADASADASAMQPIPRYELTTDGGLASTEAGEASTKTGANGRLRYRLDGKLDWRLQPADDVVGDVAVKVWAFPDAPTVGEPRLLLLEPLVQISDARAIALSGEVAELGLEPGRYTLALAFGRPAALPDQAAAVHGSEGSDTWTVRRVSIEIEGP